MARVKKATTPTTAAAAVTTPVGVTGLKRWGNRGLIWEEFLPELRGSRGIKIYREMMDNDATVGAVLYIVQVVLRQVKFDIRCEDEALEEFVEQCFEDMRPSFANFMCEVLSMLAYGWSWHEVVYKRRAGPSDDPTLSSKYTDGRIGWSCWDIRSQDSLFEWKWDDRNNLEAMLQQCPPSDGVRTIPMNRSLLFRPVSYKNSPEGRSLLRSAYRAWYRKRHIENMEGIGIERDLTGLPVCYLDGGVGAITVGGRTVEDAIREMLANIRNDEQGSILLPLVFDEQGNKLVQFELVSSPGTKQMDTTKVIQRLSMEIAQVMQADFIQLGHEKVGSFALSSSKTDMFALSLGAILQSIADVINTDAIPRLMRINGIPAEGCPTFHFGDIETPDLEKLGKYLTDLAATGMPLFPNAAMESYLLRSANLPEPSDDEREVMATVPPTPAAPGDLPLDDEMIDEEL